MKIIKIGGGKDINLPGIISDLARMNEQFIIVHGANAIRDEIAEKMDKPNKILKSLSGYSSVYSDDDAIDIIMMAYAGLQNKRIVELCQQKGINAVGLTGLDGRTVQGVRNPGIRIEEGKKIKIIRDNSGKPKSVNKDFLNLLLSNGYFPVIAIPIIDENGKAINTENDEIVRVLHESLESEMIIQLIEALGFLDDPDNPASLVNTMTVNEIEKREEQVEGRMKRKMLALKKLFESRKVKVIISDGRVENPIENALAGKGTTIS